MDIKILDSWLRDYLETNAKPADIARCLSLCGPSIEKTDKIKVNGKTDYLYHIEVTTNRVDMMSVIGIAREASVILPEFGFKAHLKSPELDNGTTFYKKNKVQIKFIPNFSLVSRMIGVILDIPKISKSDLLTTSRLELMGIRSLNNVVDITNYVMSEIGHPCHVFDYDQIQPLIKVRESKKREKITSFDGKTYSLPGKDIIFENDKGEIVDLPGIIGTKNSVVNKNTKRVLFFIECNDPTRIRNTSMSLAIRTVAATINEKGPDPYLAEIALKRGLYIFKKHLNAKQISPIVDNFKLPKKTQPIVVARKFLQNIIGVELDSKRIINILTRLGFGVNYNNKSSIYICTPPSYRVHDIQIPEDVVEEVARIYGYHNIPSRLMTGKLPEITISNHFDLEITIKRLLSAMGGNEVYNYSLVPKTNTKQLSLKNPLGSDYAALRTSLKKSLYLAADENKQETEAFHLFEMANIYKPNLNKLPDEILTLAGIFVDYEYRKAKGIIEQLLAKLNIDYTFEVTPNTVSTRLKIKPVNGRFEIVANKIYYSFELQKLAKYHLPVKKFNQIPKYPPQIEDMTVEISEGMLMGDVITKIKSASQLVRQVELIDIYKNNYTFRIWYQDSERNLNDEDVREERKKIVKILQ